MNLLVPIKAPTERSALAQRLIEFMCRGFDPVSLKIVRDLESVVCCLSLSLMATILTHSVCVLASIVSV